MQVHSKSAATAGFLFWKCRVVLAAAQEELASAPAGSGALGGEVRVVEGPAAAAGKRKRRVASYSETSPTRATVCCFLALFFASHIDTRSGKHTAIRMEAAPDRGDEQAQGEGGKAARLSAERTAQGGAGALLLDDPDWLVQTPAPHGQARLLRMASMHPCMQCV